MGNLKNRVMVLEETVKNLQIIINELKAGGPPVATGSDLEGRFGAVDGRISRLNTKVVEQDTKIAEMETNVSELKAELELQVIEIKGELENKSDKRGRKKK